MFWARTSGSIGVACPNLCCGVSTRISSSSCSSVILVVLFFFFFSSRRRHTRCSRDWSSDVCSSDLHAAMLRRLGAEPVEVRLPEQLRGLDGLIVPGGESTTITRLMRLYGLDGALQIGRASCRERVENAGVVGSVEKKRVEKVRRLR